MGEAHSSDPKRPKQLNYFPSDQSNLLYFSLTMSMNRFTLLNSNGVARPGFYIEIVDFPNGEQPGKAIYVDGRGSEDVINFIYNPETDMLDAWGIGSQHTKFMMSLVTVTDRVVGLDVHFDRHATTAVHFALDLSTEDEDIVFDVFAPRAFIAEMSSVGF